jgi:nucleoside-diphosphate-sugar epimerase
LSLLGQRILVTGGTGFIGSHLVRELIAQQADVSVVASSDLNLWRIKDVLSKVKIIKADIGSLNCSMMISEWPKVDVVYHLGAAGVNQSMDNEDAILKTNIGGTQNLLKWSHKTGIKRFVYCGSCAEYSRGSKFKETDWTVPLSIYGISKATGTILSKMYYEQYGLPVVCLRPFTAYGPYEASYRLIPSVIKHILEGKDLELTPGEQLRDFIFVKDVVDAFLIAGTKPGIEGEIFNIATGKNTMVREVVEQLVKLSDSKAKMLFGAKNYRVNEPMEQTADITKTSSLLDWKAPTSLNEGLKLSYEWFNANNTLLSETSSYG